MERPVGRILSFTREDEARRFVEWLEAKMPAWRGRLSILPSPVLNVIHMTIDLPLGCTDAEASTYSAYFQDMAQAWRLLTTDYRGGNEWTS